MEKELKETQYMEKLDYVDPVKLYAAVREEGYSFILETREKIGRHRYTFIGFAPEFVVEVKNGLLFRELETKMGEMGEISDDRMSNLPHTRFSGGFVGFAAYDAAHPYIGMNAETPSVFGYYTGYFVVDHVAGRVFFGGKDVDGEEIIRKARKIELESPEPESHIASCDAEPDEFLEMVQEAKEHVYAGDVFQVVISRKYDVETNLTPFQAYLRLRDVSPSPYMFLLEFDSVSLCGASPETLASIFNGKMMVNPIAGTIRRGSNSREDDELAARLLNDEKERAEHAMLVDLARNDVRKVCRAGSVKVERFMEVVKYSHVMHIESTVTGELAASHFRGIEAAFPAGTLTGAPKVRAMEIISEMEKSSRSVYGGGVGYFSTSGNADMAIAIRMIEFRGGKAIVRSGAGIVADSKPLKELHETERKMLPALKTLGIDSVEVGEKEVGKEVGGI
jgi:anthranilate synthase component 1